MMTKKASGIKIEGHKGTWYVIDTKEVAGHMLYLLEHEQYGEDADCLIVDYNHKIIAEDVTDGWDDVPNRFTIEVKVNGYLPERSFPGSYPLLYITKGSGDVLCGKCASEDPEDISHFYTHMEGEALVCDNCNDEIESAYGDPHEEHDMQEELGEMHARLESTDKGTHYEDDMGAYGDPNED